MDGVSFLRTLTTGAPFLRRYALSEGLGGARSWRAVYDADQACHIWGNGVQGYYEVTADRCQLESTPRLFARGAHAQGASAHEGL